MVDVTWLQVLGAAPIAIAVIFGPGLLALAPWPLRWLTRWALAAPVSLAMITLAGLIGGWCGWSWSVWQPVALAAMCALAIAIPRWSRARSRSVGEAHAVDDREALPAAVGTETAPGPAETDAKPATQAKTSPRSWLWIVIGLAIPAVVIAVRAATAIGDPALIPQNYDAVFHLNAVQFVLDTGDASSLHLYRLAHPDYGASVYPAAWHSSVALVAQLSGIGIAPSTMLMWLVVAGAVWPASIVWFTSVVVSSRTIVLTAAGVFSATFVAFPYVLLNWGTLFPTGLAYAILPVGVALAAVVLGYGRPEVEVGRWAAVWIGCVWLIAALGSHPRSVISAVFFLAPLGGFALVAWCVKAWRAGNRRRVVTVVCLIVAALVVVVAAAVYVVAVYYGTSRPVSERLTGAPALASGSIWDAIWTAVSASSLDASNTFGGPSPLLALLVMLGLVLLLRSPRTRWLTVGWLLIVAAYCLAAGSDSDFAKIATGLWYKDKQRLISLIPMVGVPAAALAVAWCSTRIAAWWRGPGRQPVIGGVTAGVLVAIPLLASRPVATMGESISKTFALTSGTNGRNLHLSASEFELLHTLRDHVPEGGVVLNNPWNGSAFGYALSGTQMLFPHLDGDFPEEALSLVRDLDQAGANPAVCQAADELGVTHVVDFGNHPTADPKAQTFTGITKAAQTGQLQEVARVGDAVLYALTTCDPPQR